MKREIIRKSRTEDGGEKKTELAERVKESITEELHWTTLGEVTQIIAGNPAPQGKEFFEAGKYPFVRVQDMGRLGNKKTLYDTKDKINDKAVSKLRLFPKGSVLFTKSGASTLLNQRAILPREMYVVSHIAAAIPTSKVISEWLYYWLLTIDFAHYAHATTLPSLPLSKAKLIPIPVLPLSQQKSTIAEIEKQFTRLDAGVAALKRAQANLKRYRAAVLKAACEGRLVPTEADLARKEGRSYETGEQLLARILEERRKKRQGRGKYKEPVGVDTKKLPTLPEGWVWASLDQIGQEGRPILYGIIKPGPHIHDGIPYVRVTEMKDGKIDVVNLKRASKERAAKFSRATLMAGDILISKDGTIGRVAVVPPELAGGNITQHVMRAPIHGSVVRNYVVWAIRSEGCQHWLTGETKGVALRGVNVEDFRRLPIPMPPIAEQNRIVDEVERKLSVVEELCIMVSLNLQRASGLRQAILQIAFKGKLS
ncbi:MAG: hypothetical protein F9K48_01890 [Candidatus Brocadia sp.]|nr:MAG: hypothetical protein F9K48_01890 [Candidatus Brocadia sp.]